MVDVPLLTSFRVNDTASEQDLRRPLEMMETFSRKSEIYSNVVGLLTSFNACILFLVGVSYQISAMKDAQAATVLLSLAVASIVVFFSAMFILSRFERIVAIGNAYYQEVSDTLEWEKMHSEVRMQSRFVLKHFVLASTLPFYRQGKHGSFVYLSLNMAISALTTGVAAYLGH